MATDLILFAFKCHNYWTNTGNIYRWQDYL